MAQAARGATSATRGRHPRHGDWSGRRRAREATRGDAVTAGDGRGSLGRALPLRSYCLDVSSSTCRGTAAGGARAPPLDARGARTRLVVGGVAVVLMVRAIARRALGAAKLRRPCRRLARRSSAAGRGDQAAEGCGVSDSASGGNPQDAPESAGTAAPPDATSTDVVVVGACCCVVSRARASVPSRSRSSCLSPLRAAC